MITEDQLEQLAIQCFQDTGWSYVNGKMLSPEGEALERMEPRLKVALADVSTIFGELPLEWLHLDGDESLPVQLDMKRVISLLELPFSDPETFWKLP